MPRYYFHTEDGSPDIDTEGMELADDAAARAAAVRYAGAVIKEQPDELLATGHFRVLVKNAANAPVCSVNVSETYW